MNRVDGKGDHLHRLPIQVVISHESELGGTLMKERITGWEPPGKIQKETTGLHGQKFPLFCLVA